LFLKILEGNAEISVQDSFLMLQVIPPFLRDGDSIGIVATARWVDDAVVAIAINTFQKAGFRVKCSPLVTRKNFQLAGSHEERVKELQQFLDDEELRAIVVIRGGYGTVHLLDHLNFDKFSTSPKWICGYSDVTALHGLLQSMGYASVHSTMPVSFGDATPKALESLLHCLRGTYPHFDAVPSKDGLTYTGDAIEGVLFGGNLSVWCSILGSRHFPQCHEGILFLEDVDEMLYHIDRMLMMLHRAGALTNIKAICLGGFTQMKDNTREFGFSVDNPWGRTAEESVSLIAEQLKIPVFSGFPAGHLSDNQAFYLGRRCRVHSWGDVNRIEFI
jgi:muramoyltetrapeptide carboxypeptidase